MQYIRDGEQTSDGRPIHDFVFGDRLVLAERVGPRSDRLPFDDGYLHMLNLDPNEKEVDLPHNHILQVVSGTHTRICLSNYLVESAMYLSDSLGFVVFELDVKTVLDADLHFDAAVGLRIC